ncbi:hypothetical protein QQ045_018650 [Rhodiola kirilowii]
MWMESTLGTAICPLSVRYLGISLNSKGLLAADCRTIIKKITNRIKAWSNRFLSRAERRVLVQSFLQSMVFYWARVCILPKKIIQTVDSICARFLWKSGSQGRSCNLVCWEDVCKEKFEGGLGIKNLNVMNEAMVMNQLWAMSKEEDSLWKFWTAAYWTKGRN